MIDRSLHRQAVKRLLSRFPVVAILGARQVGKTTLAGQVAKAHGKVTVLDLESPADLARLADPLLALESLRGLVVIDEVQRAPDLFQVLRVLADRPRTPARFLILGSASPDLLRQSSETLAGRIAYHDLGGLGLDEVGASRLEQLWLRGGFPRAFLARSNKDSMLWREQFIRTYLERDLPTLGFRTPPTTLRRFWTMLAHYHGQTWNASELGRALGANPKTAEHYLDVLSGTFVVRRLAPWLANLKKRQVKSPKVYVADSGLLHALLGLGDQRTLEGHPKVGASWEGFLVEQILSRTGTAANNAYFWSTHAGPELDLLLERGGRLHGFEIKRTTSPRLTDSMKNAADALGLASLTLVHAGRDTFEIARGVRAVAAERLLEDL